jgi:hypothetical protein
MTHRNRLSEDEFRTTVLRHVCGLLDILIRRWGGEVVERLRVVVNRWSR